MTQGWMVVGSDRAATMHSTLVEATERADELLNAKPDDTVLVAEIVVTRSYSVTNKPPRKGKQ